MGLFFIAGFAAVAYETHVKGNIQVACISAHGNWDGESCKL
jgi:hypothetical protein